MWLSASKTGKSNVALIGSLLLASPCSFRGRNYVTTFENYVIVPCARHNPEREGPLTAVMQGVGILEVAEHTFLPAASALMSDWGAEVIKIVHAERGDATRGPAST